MKRIIEFLKLRNVFIFIFLIFFIFYFSLKSRFNDKNIVNVYDWYGVIPIDVLKKFEEETGIHVNYDIFDHNDVLEAKLLASNSGYDVVFPTVTPYAERQLYLKIYQKINKEFLSNLGEIDWMLLREMEGIDKNLDYILPYYWGTSGIVYDENIIKNFLPNVDLESYEIIFNVENLKKLSDHGVSLLLEAVDVFPAVMAYLHLDPGEINFQNILKAAKHLNEMRKYITKFSTSRIINDIALHEICVAQAWSGEAMQAISGNKTRKIKYVIPKEFSEIWIDGIAIPKEAPNVINAHKFINYLLKPEVSAKLTNYSRMATMVVASKKFIHKKIVECKIIFPDDDVKKRLHLPKRRLCNKSHAYEKIMTRLWTQIRTGREIDLSALQSEIKILNDENYN